MPNHTYPKIIVLCMNSEGAPEFHSCSPEVTQAQIDSGEHYALGMENAVDNGYSGPMIAFDESDPAAKQLAALAAFLAGRTPAPGVAWEVDGDIVNISDAAEDEANGRPVRYAQVFGPGAELFADFIGKAPQVAAQRDELLKVNAALNAELSLALSMYSDVRTSLRKLVDASRSNQEDGTPKSQDQIFAEAGADAAGTLRRMDLLENAMIERKSGRDSTNIAQFAAGASTGPTGLGTQATHEASL